MKKAYFIFNFLSKFKKIITQYKKNRAPFRYTLINVTAENSENIDLHVIVSGIKQSILKFKPEEVIKDDELLLEFSPLDVRAITYLALERFMMKASIGSLNIEKQFIRSGETLFALKDEEKTICISAKQLYKKYHLMMRLSKRDMITVISTAVQEQTLEDVKMMGIV